MLFGLLATLGAFADEMVQIPGDFNGEEIPVGAVFQPKEELILPGSTSEIDVLKRDSMSNGNRLVTKCDLTYASETIRRIIPKGASLRVESVNWNALGTTTPANCWKDNEPREWKEVVYIVGTKAGFRGSLRCYHETIWINPNKERCEFYESPSAEQLGEKFLLWAEKSKLSKVVGDN